MRILFWLVLTTMTILVSTQEHLATIIRDDRNYPVRGLFSVDVETDNRIKISEAGNEQLVRTGVISYPLPNGEIFTMKYVADATGFKPESPFLPVAPIFPHAIPAHSLRQIERARLERENKEINKN